MSARTPARAVYAVLGHPVGHSLSPTMQNAAFRAAGIDAIYRALDVEPSQFAASLATLHAEGVAGVNLTAPHKEAAWDLVVEATPEAERTRAPNTLRRVASGWAAHATDGPGFAAWVQELGVTLQGTRVLLLGAGGAARAIVPALAALGVADAVVVSRSGERAQRLAAWAKEAGAATQWRWASLGDSQRTAESGARDLAVRALSAGTVTSSEGAWWAGLRAGAPVLDLNYGARVTETRDRANREGRRFEDGLGLLLHQGALSFEFWTGRAAPMDAMREALRRHDVGS